MKIMRTPASRFDNLPDYPFEPQFAEVDGLRVHFVDEGPRDGEVVLLLHGEPTWSYLYRHMIPPLVSAGLRAVAPDLPGFGKSDKPRRRGAYSYERHVRWMTAFVEAVGLECITLVCQDWGSLIGLRVAAENESRFARVVVANGGLPTGDQEMPKAFRTWQAFARYSPWFPIGKIVQSGTRRRLTDDERRAYDAPFPSYRYKAGARAFPLLVPSRPDDPAAPANRAAWETFGRWQKPFLTAFGNRDPITRGANDAFIRHVPGARAQPHRTILDAGHFIQEDAPAELAAAVTELVKSKA